MRPDRIVPLIIAVALFMENMDSTVIATSLPAIAADIGTNPLALKLAVTSYLLSLAIFIPASGWTADRFGARTVFRAAIAVFVIGSIGCALSNSLTDFVIARIVQGMGGAMMTPVGRMVLEAPFSSAADVGARAFWFLPVRLLMKDRFHSDRRISRVTVPVLILHGARDAVVPIGLGERLFALANEPKRFVRFADGGHEDLDAFGAQEAFRAFWRERR
jgi:fermentation-respiration switch protein FrsA (DUF1100 family)